MAFWDPGSVFSSMRIALINEDSQADKNSLIYEVLTKIAHKYAHTVDNYGMFTEKDPYQINYIQVGILASIILDTDMADFVVTGCGTGQGAMISCNAFQNVICGYASSPLDAYLFSQINAGNAISIPYAQQFGWGSEINLEMIFEQLFSHPFGQGYPQKFANEESISRVKMSTDIKERTQRPVLEALKELDQKSLKHLIGSDAFRTAFEKRDPQGETADYIRSLLNN